MLLQLNVEWISQKCLMDNISPVQASNTAMANLIITQIKSGINRPLNQKRTLVALGLRINKTVEHTATPQIRGMVAKVSHLVTVVEK